MLEAWLTPNEVEVSLVIGRDRDAHGLQWRQGYMDQYGCPFPGAETPVEGPTKVKVSVN